MIENIAVCTEFPSLSWLAKAPDEALKRIQKLVGDVVKDMQVNSEPIPLALAN